MKSPVIAKLIMLHIPRSLKLHALRNVTSARSIHKFDNWRTAPRDNVFLENTLNANEEFKSSYQHVVTGHHRYVSLC